MQLSPGVLLAHTGLKPDAAVLPGWTLFDVGWTRDRSGLRVELSGPSGGASLELRVGNGFDLRGPVEQPSLVAAIRQRWAGSLGGARGVMSPGLDDLLVPFAQEPAPVEMALPSGPDHDLIRTELANYERYCGVKPTVLDVGGGEPGLRYPPSETAAELGALRAVPCEILERRVHRELITAMGFSIERDGLLRTVPTPETFRRRVTAAGRTPGIVPVLRSIRGAQQGPAWTESLLGGEFVVGVPKSWTLAVPLLRVPVSTLAHDLGFHCLPLQFVTAAQWAEMRAAITSRPKRDRGSASELTTWLEGPMTNACWETWAAADTPRDAERLLGDRWEELCEAREVIRLRRRGP